MAPVPTPPVARLLDLLTDIKPARGYWTALCPAHDDQQNSLSVGIGKQDGRALVKCHAGCTVAAILTAINLTMTDLFPGEHTNGTAKSVVPAQGVTTRPKLIKTYDYYRADGTMAFQACRFEPKTFRQRHRNGNGEWTWSLEGVDLVPFRLPE